MATGITKLSIKEKIGYGLGDGAANFFFQTIMMFQVVYFTDVFQLDEKKASILFLVALFWNGIFDPIMGAIADKTKTRWGKFRPWILWSSVPFGVIFYLTYLTPDLEGGIKLVYAYATYIGMMTIYSINNTPYSALSGVLTGDTDERTSIASYRQVIAMSGAFIIQGFFLTIKNHFAVNSEAQGWRVAIGIFAGAAIVFHLITFLSTKERIVPKKEEESSFKEALGDLFKTGPWIVLFLATLFIFVNLSLRGNMLYMYFTKYLDAAVAQDFLGKFGFGTLAKPGEKAFEIFNMVGMSFTILGIIISKPLSVKFGKRNVFLYGLLAAAIFSAIFWIPTNSDIGLAYGINILLTLSFGLTVPLLWSMLGDVADFSAWKFNRRSTGVVFAGVSFALKVGLGFGVASATLLKGYYSTVVGGEKVLDVEGVRMGASIYPAILFGIAVVCLAFYTIDTKMEQKIQEELEERRKA